MGRLQEMLKVGPVFSYFGRVFKKDKDGKYPASTNLKMMHGINKISIVLFLIAVIVMIIRAFTRE
ncbi:MAG: hypothetical protein KAX81_04100 [Leadbetterella sp.]|jgi:hypothetical protein|uniref:DUF6728 family protein n=1 Tax=Lacihabitans sp. CCS-44 TaxID=2487331 RepID=UPI001B545392|nr:DUF6728 family protein [Lacihabitans sp. CCS-44]MBP8156186.1 hypothetical protein [Leadbetterella sp.]MCP9755039.1 hypothetical protein [Lacihabitans sp. CCS-44]